MCLEPGPVPQAPSPAFLLLRSAASFLQHRGVTKVLHFLIGSKYMFLLDCQIFLDLPESGHLLALLMWGRSWGLILSRLWMYSRLPTSDTVERSVYDLVSGDLPGGPVVKTSSSNVGGVGLIPSQGAKIPHVLQSKKQNIKQKPYSNKFNKDFKKRHSLWNQTF